MADSERDAGVRVERRDEREGARDERAGYVPPEMDVREEDLEPHAGLRYIARMFKILAILLVLLLIAEIIIGLAQQGQAAIPRLLVEATRLIVFAGLLWGAADMGLMLIESNHDLRATRILVGRLNGRIQRLEELASSTFGLGSPPSPPRPPSGSPGAGPPPPPPPSPPPPR